VDGEGADGGDRFDEDVRRRREGEEVDGGTWDGFVFKMVSIGEIKCGRL
jgi:hypothetical protein